MSEIDDEDFLWSRHKKGRVLYCVSVLSIIGTHLLVALQINSTTWLPEKRAKYNDKRRQKDLDLVYSNWDLSKEMTETMINIADVPAKAKKFKRVVAVHGYEWGRGRIRSTAIRLEIWSRGDPRLSP